MKNSLVVVKRGNLSAALVNATSRYNLTPEQAEDLNCALELCSMNPASALSNLRSMTPEFLACCLSIRADYEGESDLLPSIPAIAEVLENQGFSGTDTVFSTLDLQYTAFELEEGLQERKWRKERAAREAYKRRARMEVDDICRYY